MPATHNKFSHETNCISYATVGNHCFHSSVSDVIREDNATHTETRFLRSCEIVTTCAVEIISSMFRHTSQIKKPNIKWWHIGLSNIMKKTFSKILLKT